MRIEFASGTRWSRPMLALVAFASIALLVSQPSATGQNLSSGIGNLRVMSTNMYLGADISPAMAAASPEGFVAAVAEIMATVRASGPRARLAAIARDIAAAQPQLVGLQEVTTWSSGPDPSNLSVEFDYLPLLLAELSARGLSYSHYYVQHFDFTAPAFGEWVQLKVGVAMLARNDLPANVFQVSNVTGERFQTFFSIPLDSLAPGLVVPSHRAWTAADVTFRGRQFRFVNTHLEPFAPPVTVAQANELVHGTYRSGEFTPGPANTSQPVVMTGDFNADAHNPQSSSFAAYAAVRGANFDDLWPAVHPYHPGFTCCQSPTLNNSLSMHSARIDFIFTRGPWHAQAAQLFGVDPDERAGNGVWPSDHAGIAGRLQMVQ